MQIAMGAPLLAKKPESTRNPVDLALLELDKNLIPMTVKREGKIIKGPVV